MRFMSELLGASHQEAFILLGHTASSVLMQCSCCFCPFCCSGLYDMASWKTGILWKGSWNKWSLSIFVLNLRTIIF